MKAEKILSALIDRVAEGYGVRAKQVGVSIGGSNPATGYRVMRDGVHPRHARIAYIWETDGAVAIRRSVKDQRATTSYHADMDTAWRTLSEALRLDVTHPQQRRTDHITIID